MKTIQVKAEGYNLIVIDDTPIGSHRIYHAKYGYVNVYYDTSDKKILSLETLETEPGYRIVGNAEISVINPIVSAWCNGLTRWGHDDEVVEKVSIYEGSIYDTDLNKRQLFINENAIELNDGKFLIKDFGKYGSHLLVIAEKPAISFSKSIANIGGKELEEVKGRFFTTKKGSKALDTTTTNPTHILYKDGWGGCFNDYRGNKLVEGLYNYRAHSNGGGAGYDYAVYEIGNIPRPSIEDF